MTWVMASPRTDISRSRFGASKSIEAREEDYWRMEHVSLGIESLDGM